MPGVVGWTGPASQDGALDDGSVPSFSGDIIATINAIPGGTAVDTSMIPATTFFDYSTLTAPYADVAGCMAYTDPGGFVAAHKARHDCLCQSCFTLMQQCDAQPGCQAVVKCEADSGCTDSNSCYLLPGAMCVIPINQWGVGGVEVGLSQNLGTCGTSASPACPNH